MLWLKKKTLYLTKKQYFCLILSELISRLAKKNMRNNYILQNIFLIP